MSKGRQDAGPEWCAICEYVRTELLRVCPLSNRRFTAEWGTFRRREVAKLSGVSLANMARMMDERLPSSPDTITKLSKFLGLKVRIDRVGPPPYPRKYLDGSTVRYKPSGELAIRVVTTPPLRRNTPL